MCALFLYQRPQASVPAHSLSRWPTWTLCRAHTSWKALRPGPLSPEKLEARRQGSWGVRLRESRGKLQSGVYQEQPPRRQEALIFILGPYGVNRRNMILVT